MIQKQRSYAGTQSVVRALQLLKVFRDTQPEWSLSDLVTETGLNKTTAFRMLTALESEGLIRRTADNNYRLGSEAIAIGGRAMRANELRTLSHGPLRQLAHTTGETTTLEILRPDETGRLTTLVIDETLGKYRVGITQYIGSRLPIHATSTGKALLAYQPADLVNEVLDQPLGNVARPPTAEQLRRELAEVRERGFAIAAGVLEDGVMATAAPIFDHNRQAKAAISIVGPSLRVDHAKLLEFADLVVETTQRISHALGYRSSTEIESTSQEK